MTTKSSTKLAKQRACKHEHWEYDCTGSHELFYRCRDCGAWTSDRYQTNYWYDDKCKKLGVSPV